MPIRLTIQETPPEAFAPTPLHPSAQFIEGAVRAAKYSIYETRKKIIADISELLNCHEKDLNFMFEHHLVPVERRPIFELELPDYRMTLSEIYKEAAE
ncbi:hypothetical protein N9W89_13625 [Hellea sp.]|nr:hypothetical protein [Hellea sp.]